MQRLQQKKMSQDEDGDVQDLAVLKRIKRAAESDIKKLASERSERDTLRSLQSRIVIYI